MFSGSAVALITPFHKDKSINYEKMDELIEMHCENGTAAIVVCGTTGEAATLSETEQLSCIQFALERVKGRVPVIAGTGLNCTRAAVERSKRAEQCGADGLLVVTPYYNKCTQEGLVSHYKFIAKEVQIPLILYSVASRTGVNIEPETVAILYKEIENVIAIKEASGNISQVAKIMNLTDGKMTVYSGNDDQTVPVLSLGGKGVISVLANIAPRYMREMCDKYFQGDLSGSRQMQLKAIPLIESLFSEVNPIPVKKAMQMMGMDSGELRLPLTEMSQDKAEKLSKRLKQFEGKVV